MSSLGNRLMEIRKKFVLERGKLLISEELEREIAEHREVSAAQFRGH